MLAVEFIPDGTDHSTLWCIYSDLLDVTWDLTVIIASIGTQLN